MVLSLLGKAMFKRVLKNVFEAVSARRKLSKKRSLHPVNEHFEAIFNTAIATQIVFQQPDKIIGLCIDTIFFTLAHSV